MGIGRIICALLSVYILIMLVRALLSWFPISYDSPLHRVQAALDKVTEPVLRPIRNLIPPVRMGGIGLDISFMIVFFGLVIIASILCGG